MPSMTPAHRAPGWALCARPWEIPCPRVLEGLHFHTLCEQDSAPLVETFRCL